MSLFDWLPDPARRSGLVRFAAFCENAAHTARAGSAAIDLGAEAYALCDRAVEAREIIDDDRTARALQKMIEDGDTTPEEIDRWLAEKQP